MSLMRVALPGSVAVVHGGTTLSPSVRRAWRHPPHIKCVCYNVVVVVVVVVLPFAACPAPRALRLQRQLAASQGSAKYAPLSCAPLRSSQ
eukprot:1144503-Pelagomonas_calceolata.AAC.3